MSARSRRMGKIRQTPCHVGIFRLQLRVMENEMRAALLSVATAYASARSIELSTLAQRAAGDWRFFDRLKDEEKSFTARKFDEVMRFLSDTWPEQAVWPDHVGRPSPPTSPESIEPEPQKARAS